MKDVLRFEDSRQRVPKSFLLPPTSPGDVIDLPEFQVRTSGLGPPILELAKTHSYLFCFFICKMGANEACYLLDTGRQ